MKASTLTALLLCSLSFMGCGASSSDATGPNLRCSVVLHQEDTNATATSGASVGNTTQNCGPQDSPNRPKTITNFAPPPEE